MYRAPHICPVCTGLLQTTRLGCPTCGTTIEGHFERSPLERLSNEQLHFVEALLRNEGKITWAADELRLTYPNARALLLEIVNTLGGPSTPRPAATDQRQETLRRLAAGELSAEEALQIINRP